MKSAPYRQITESQRAFLLARGVGLDRRGWAVDYRENLFSSLHPDSLRDFNACREIDEDGKGGRVSAPHSSTALAVNTFDWWRGRDLSPIADALGVDIDRFVGFEQPHDFGLDRPSRPDVELTTNGGSHVVVEVKLREPYDDISNSFADKYFTSQNLWAGLPNLEKLAERIREEPRAFSTLHAAQLIKHALGLQHTHGKDSTLVYYWHYVPGEIGDRHLKEIAAFEDAARSDISFVPITVEKLVGRIATSRESEPWFNYMTTRYLSAGHLRHSSMRPHHQD